MKKKYYVYEMNINILNIISIIILVFMTLLSFLINKTLLIKSFVINDYFIFIMGFVCYLIFHEILHSIAYIIHGANFKNITYGMALEKGVFYCLCKQNINKKNILISLMYPLFFIGIVTYIISLIYDLPFLHLLSICNIAGAAGDIIMFIFILKMPKDIEYSEFDSETSFGIYTNKDISKEKHFGLKYLGTKDTLKREDKTKIKISKVSKIVLIIMILFGLLTELI